MNKIAGGNRTNRLAALIISFLPLFLVVFIGLTIGNDYVIFSYGYFVFYLVWIIIISLNLYLNFFDWDVYFSNKNLVIRSYFNREVVISDIKRVEILSIPILSIGLELFLLKYGNNKFLFKINSDNILNRLSVNKKIVKFYSKFNSEP